MSVSGLLVALAVFGGLYLGIAAIFYIIFLVASRGVGMWK